MLCGVTQWKNATWNNALNMILFLVGTTEFFRTTILEFYFQKLLYIKKLHKKIKYLDYLKECLKCSRGDSELKPVVRCNDNNNWMFMILIEFLWLMLTKTFIIINLLLLYIRLLLVESVNLKRYSGFRCR